MIIFTLAFGAAAVILLIRCIRYRLEIRSVCRQLDELAQGSHMELFVNRKHKAFVQTESGDETEPPERDAVRQGSKTAEAEHFRPGT